MQNKLHGDAKSVRNARSRRLVALRAVWRAAHRAAQPCSAHRHGAQIRMDVHFVHRQLDYVEYSRAGAQDTGHSRPWSDVGASWSGGRQADASCGDLIWPISGFATAMELARTKGGLHFVTRWIHKANRKVLRHP